MPCLGGGGSGRAASRKGGEEEMEEEKMEEEEDMYAAKRCTWRKYETEKLSNFVRLESKKENKQPVVLVQEESDRIFFILVKTVQPVNTVVSITLSASHTGWGFRWHALGLPDHRLALKIAPGR